MADELDQTSERMQFDISASIQLIRKKAQSFQHGQEGDCDLCGEHFSRVIEVERNGNMVLSCGRCRDIFGLD